MTSSEIGVDAYNRLVAKSLCRIKQSKQLPIFIVVCSTTRMLGLFAVLHACMHACTHTYSGLLSCCIQYSEAAQCIQEVSVDSLCLDVSVLLIPKFSLLQGS